MVVDSWGGIFMSCRGCQTALVVGYIKIDVR